MIMRGEGKMRLGYRQSKHSHWGAVVALLIFVCVATGCGERQAEAPAAAQVSPAADADADAPLPPPAYEADLPPSAQAALSSQFTGDLDEMVARRMVRIGAPYSRTFFFIDKGVQRGVSYELAKAFEDELNKSHKAGSLPIRVVLIPVPRDQLASALTQGKIDVAAAQVTIRPELQALVDFTNPTRTNISEVVVTAPGAPPIASVDDLAGKDVFTRKDSKYYQSLVALNERLKAQGKPTVVIREVPGNLEDDDLLEMVNAGLIPAIVVDNYLAEFWKQVFTNITVHDNVTLRTNANLALAVRKNSPQLVAELNAFLKKFGLGTAVGNVLEKRYLVSTTYAKNAASEAEQKKFLALVDLFRKYSQEFDVDYLLMAAQGYQESQLNHDAKSHVGAVGVMQLMPATGAEMKVGDITQLDANIHAGVKYMRFMMDRYFKDEPMDQLNKGLFTFASYNAGPGRIRQLRREAEKRGLDPNVWFGNVEQIASERIGRETVTYVANIYKYYIAYRLIVDDRARRAEAKATLEAKTK
jgi:membrane-bound lytic murein transglycosylase MltF